MKWKTKFTDLTGCKYPIIMGAFAGLGKPHFAAPVSEAGALGIITSHNYRTLKVYEAALEKMEELQKPYGINFSIRPPVKEGAFLAGFDFDKYLDVALKNKFEHLVLVSTSAYKGAKYGKRARENGKIWLHKCATMKHALSADKDKPDFIVIVGLEGTGFKNKIQNTTLINNTMAKRLLQNASPIAAGGIGDARGFLSCLMMGASAVCLGTSLMATKECPTSDRFKERMLNQDPFEEEFHKKIFHLTTKDSPIYSMAIGFLDKNIPTIKEFIEKMISDAEEILKKIGFQQNEIRFY
ncbi:MAG: nitronate monooxygenase [Candidatus Lokiarchaeota archaeon]|nr:nitronate monooxygenase [Candidatus Lokiarchaeota archaeon]